MTRFKFWIDVNLPPKAAIWLNEQFGVDAYPAYALGLLSQHDNTIFARAREQKEMVVIITKDEDFAEMVMRLKSPPKIIWITAGNLSNSRLRTILIANFAAAMEQLKSPGCDLVEIG